MLANSFFLFTFDVNSQQSLEVLMEVLILHLIHHIHNSKIIFYHLIRISQIGADELIVLEVFYFYLRYDLV